MLAVLFAIAVHEYFNAGNKSAEPGSLEAKYYVGAIVRGEQAYFLPYILLTSLHFLSSLWGALQT